MPPGLDFMPSDQTMQVSLNGPGGQVATRRRGETMAQIVKL